MEVGDGQRTLRRFAVACLECCGTKTGELTPRAQGRRRASSIDGYAGFIVGMIEERKDITSNEMIERLDTERSMCLGRSALSDWLGGYVDVQKNPHMHLSRTTPTSRSAVAAGSTANPISIRPSWSS
jgi:hypothetical protein